MHVELDERTVTTGVVLCDQAKMLDVNARNAKVIEHAPKDIVEEVVAIVQSFIA